MKLNRPFTNLLISIIALFYAVLEGYLLVFALEAGKLKTLRLVILIPLFILVIALLPRFRIQTIIGFVLLLFWIPAGFDNWVLYIFEILLYAILFLIIIRFISIDNEKVKSFMTSFPWFLFVLYIMGALLTWLFSKKIGGELNIIRAMCFLPLALSMVIFLTIQSPEGGDRYLWMILTSAAVLGLLFLVGRKFLGFVTLSDYAAGSGRLSMILSIPYVGSLIMLPQSTSNWFGYLSVFAYTIWLFHPSPLRRTYAVILCLLFGSITIATQGRGGVLQAGIGAAIVSIYATFTRRFFGIRGIWIKFALVSLFVIGGLLYTASQSTNVAYSQRVVSLLDDPFNDSTISYRLNEWSNGIKLYLANPILGIGLRGIDTPWGPDTSEILNYFLYNLLSYGLLGFSSIMLILLNFLTTFWKGIHSGNRITRMMCIACIAGMFGFFLGMQPGNPYSTIIVWAPLSITFAVASLQENRSSVQPQFRSA